MRKIIEERASSYGFAPILPCLECKNGPLSKPPGNFLFFFIKTLKIDSLLATSELEPLKTTFSLSRPHIKNPFFA